MSENLYTALVALLVGMLTVFIVLSLVVLTGRVLIFLINRYFPIKEQESFSIAKKSSSQKKQPIAIHPTQLVAIITAVEIATNGKGKIRKVEKY